MTFADSIKTCLSKYAEFNGRASRSELWWFLLFVWLVTAVLSMISETLGGVFYLGMFLPSIAAAARRLHDTDKSGWMQLIALIPIVGGLIVIYFLVQPAKEPNRFGALVTGP